jgi:hypothetical protein
MIFDNVTLSFKGQEYEVKDARLWGLAEAVEDVVSLVWLAPRLSQGDIPAGKIFRAYANALQYAGCKEATAEAIKSEVGYDGLIQMAYELAGILTITQPDSDIDLGEVSDGEEAEKKPEAA